MNVIKLKKKIMNQKLSNYKKRQMSNNYNWLNLNNNCLINKNKDIKLIEVHNTEHQIIIIINKIQIDLAIIIVIIIIVNHNKIEEI